MTLLEYIEKLQKIVKENPDFKDAELIEYNSTVDRDVRIIDLELTTRNFKFNGCCGNQRLYTDGKFAMIKPVIFDS